MTKTLMPGPSPPVARTALLAGAVRIASGVVPSHPCQQHCEPCPEPVRRTLCETICDVEGSAYCDAVGDWCGTRYLTLP